MASDKKKVLVPIADGSEDIESVTIIDVLRRAGAEVVVASVAKEKQVTCARGTRVVADVLIDDVKNQHFDMISLPGGMPGAEHLRDNATLITLLKEQNQAGKHFSAICASPAVVFQAHGLIGELSATCHPSFKEKLPTHVDQRVVSSKNLCTSQGPGTALEFSLKLVEILYGQEAAKKVGEPMVLLKQ